MKLTIIETPYAGDVERNVEYARECMRHSLMRGESPYASHLLYTQPGILDDAVEAERELGINAGFEWKRSGALTVFYIDLGMSPGMEQALKHCMANGLPYELRRIK